MFFVKLIVSIFKIIVWLIVTAVEACFWILHLLVQFFYKLFDIGKASRSIRKGVLYCPRGHAVSTDDGVYECSACGYVYEGSIWRCPNPECPDPVTSHIECPVCGLSIRNPYRTGRP